MADNEIDETIEPIASNDHFLRHVIHSSPRAAMVRMRSAVRSAMA